MSCRNKGAPPGFLCLWAAAIFVAACTHPPKAGAWPSAPVRGASRPGTDPAPVASLRLDIDHLLGQPALERGYWGVLVRSLKTGETLFSRNARKLMMPASNMKIITLAAAAERLGWDFAYETRLLAAGLTERGTLAGDLIVIGSGDPSFTSADGMADRVFAEWAERLRQLGIHTIAGRIVGDDRATEDDPPLGFGWSWDDLPDDYAAGVSALQFNENMARVTLSPGPAVGDAAGVAITPTGSGLTIFSSVTTAPRGSQPAIRTIRRPGSSRLEFRGTIPLGSAPVVARVSVDDPTLFFVSVLRAALIAHGIDVRAPAVADHSGDLCAPVAGRTAPGESVNEAPLRSGSDARAMPACTQLPQPVRMIATYRSAPLSVLAQRLMKASQNQYAETLLKTIGAADGSPTAEGGRTAARAILERWGVPDGSVIQRDGSGLSRYDYVTPEALVTVLAHIDEDEGLRAPFVAALPVAGQDGTLADRMKGTTADGNAHAKTGSTSNVRSLSGYVTSADGEVLVFAIIANNFDAPADVVVRSSDAIVVRLAQFRR
jgi:D-alanyl-D-alanine carboxypeptidase/D-alanyl-D-alanine-endopeptidase (penicillin-binding protein 4)